MLGDIHLLRKQIFDRFLALPKYKIFWLSVQVQEKNTINGRSHKSAFWNSGYPFMFTQYMNGPL